MGSWPPQVASPSFEELATQQGVTVVNDFERLMGEPTAEDESAEDFSTMLRAWRSEGTEAHDPG